MTALVTGLITSTFILLLILVIGYFIKNHISDYIVYETRYRKMKYKTRKRIKMIFIVICNLLCLTMFVVIVNITIDVSTKMYYNAIEVIEAQSEMITSSVDNEKLSGFERVELVKQANVINERILKLQFNCNQWYGFDIPSEVQDLKLITFE